MKKALFLILVFFFAGCATSGRVPLPEKTQLQIREYQTRTYETDNVKMVTKAMLNVLQDDGFVVKNVNMDLGLLSAEKSINIEKNMGREVSLAILFGVFSTLMPRDSTAITECTANVSEYGSKARVRVTFQTKILNDKGGVSKVMQIEDEKFYQEFFSKVDKGIFIQKEKL